MASQRKRLASGSLLSSQVTLSPLLTLVSAPGTPGICPLTEDLCLKVPVAGTLLPSHSFVLSLLE